MTPNVAATHRVGPLLYWHLKAYGISYPQAVRKSLAAMYARQKLIAAAQAETLSEIITAFSAAGLDSVVLKGGALAHVIYPEPGLRPMEDLDILIPPDRAGNARAILLDLGFNAPSPGTRYDRLQHHLPIAHRTRNGVTVSVELHTRAFNMMMRDSLSMTNMRQPLLDFSVAGHTMHTLNPVQMLWMQYLGLRKLAEPLRYIQLADLVGMAEVLFDKIDWPALRATYPDLWHAYEAIHAFSPLGESVCATLGLDPENPAAMAIIGQDYRGWPLHGFGEQRRHADKWRLLLNTLFPPEWWARLVYGVDTSRGMAGIRLFRHPQTFVQQGMRRLYLGPVNPNRFFKTSV